MSPQNAKGITRRHREILDVLWEAGEATSVEIAQRLEDGPADSTVRSLLQIMDERGLVSHDGSAYRRKYRAAVTKEAVEDAALNALLDARYNGSVDALLNELIDSDLLDAGALDRARARLEPSAIESPRNEVPPADRPRRRPRTPVTPSRATRPRFPVPVLALAAGITLAAGVAVLFTRR